MFENTENRAPTAVERSEMNRHLRTFPIKQKLAFLRKICPDGAKIVIEREFAVIDTSQHPRFGGCISIMHLPSMLWRKFNLSFEQALFELQYSGHDKDLVSAIYNLD
jgi:hypothetical protein